MKAFPFAEQIRRLVAQDRLEEALQQLQELLKDTPQLNAAILQSRRFEAVEKALMHGTATEDIAGTEKNRIALGLLNLLDELEGKTATATDITQAAQNPTIIQKAEKIYNINRIDKADFS